MKYAAAIALFFCVGCAAKAQHKKNLFEFVNLQPGHICEVDEKLTRWDAKTGALVLTCKSVTKK
jgi:hypothetical protein